jgi:hypothetical protein
MLHHIFPAASVKTNEGRWVAQRLNDSGSYCLPHDQLLSSLCGLYFGEPFSLPIALSFLRYLFRYDGSMMSGVFVKYLHTISVMNIAHNLVYQSWTAQSLRKFSQNRERRPSASVSEWVDSTRRPRAGEASNIVVCGRGLRSHQVELWRSAAALTIGREKKNLSTVSESDHERSHHLNPGPPSVWKDHTKDTYRNSNFVIFT